MFFNEFLIKNLLIRRGCGFLLDEWYGEETGIKQIITNEDGENF